MVNKLWRTLSSHRRFGSGRARMLVSISRQSSSMVLVLSLKSHTHTDTHKKSRIYSLGNAIAVLQSKNAKGWKGKSFRGIKKWDCRGSVRVVLPLLVENFFLSPHSAPLDYFHPPGQIKPALHAQLTQCTSLPLYGPDMLHSCPSFLCSALQDKLHFTLIYHFKRVPLSPKTRHHYNSTVTQRYMHLNWSLASFFTFYLLFKADMDL